MLDISLSIDPLSVGIEIILILFLFRWSKWERKTEEKKEIVELIRQALDAQTIEAEQI